jgi:hypothetical protein
MVLPGQRLIMLIQLEEKEEEPELKQLHYFIQARIPQHRKLKIGTEHVGQK